MMMPPKNSIQPKTFEKSAQVLEEATRTYPNWSTVDNGKDHRHEHIYQRFVDVDGCICCGREPVISQITNGNDQDAECDTVQIPENI